MSVLLTLVLSLGNIIHSLAHTRRTRTNKQMHKKWTSKCTDRERKRKKIEWRWKREAQFKFGFNFYSASWWCVSWLLLNWLVRTRAVVMYSTQTQTNLKCLLDMQMWVTQIRRKNRRERERKRDVTEICLQQLVEMANCQIILEKTLNQMLTFNHDESCLMLQNKSIDITGLN